MSEEDRIQSEKGLKLAAYLEHLAQTDETFRQWLQMGIDEIEAGEVVIFDENGWSE